VLTGVIVTVVALALVAAAVLAGRWLRRRMLDPPGVRSAAQALWTAGLAAPPLREGLTPRSVEQALPYLLGLLETPGVAHCGPDGMVLGADGPPRRPTRWATSRNT
jgi:two-component system LytT family sensor kinase